MKHLDGAAGTERVASSPDDRIGDASPSPDTPPDRAPRDAGFLAGEKHYLYLGAPDGAQSGGSGNGVLVFDIDNGHKFVKRISIPVFGEGLRGLTGNLVNHSLYYSTGSARLGAFDLETEKVVWDRTYTNGCCDRSSITVDGKEIYAPSGYWYSGSDAGFLVANAQDGTFLRRIPVGTSHNSIASLDGKYVYLGTEGMLSAIDPVTDAVVKQIKNVGITLVWPFTVDHLNQFAYVCLRGEIGFDVVDLTKQAAVYRVRHSPLSSGFTHGAGLTPDEKELWISDQAAQKLYVFDNTKMPPVEKDVVRLSTGGHGWVSFSMDGRFGWNHTPDVIDAATKQKIATLMDENGKPTQSSKFVEVHFRDGKVIRVGSEFGLGRYQR